MKAPQATDTSHALRSAVREYFTLLQAELRGRRWWDSARPGALFDHFSARNREQVALRHRQISAILIGHGLPYLPSSQPLADVEPELADAVAQYLHNHPDILELMERDVFRRVDTVPEVGDPLEVVASRPTGSELPRPETNSRNSRLLAGVDFLAREQRNHSLATAGQRFVMKFEAARLRADGREAHANAIEHVTVEIGDGPGYAIHSYGLDGSDRLIEVKTTRYGRETPFYLSAHEVAMSHEYGNRFWIYRVFSFREQPRLYMLRGPVNR
ncbi:MAG: DUF3883 domain-containing protein, partial [Halofilum sp. (in: g-proteobacteria)]|nr:DUF3883 domain-containing protein [Halofilum sp. (in: g-proteobacteria)]